MSTSEFKNHVYALMVAGGGGTRLWPMSREKTPKQFLKLFSGRTLMQVTSERINKFLPWERIYVTTVSEDYKREIISEVPRLKPENIFVEPVRRDSAPAHGLGALYIHNKDKDAVIINVAVDHFIKTDEEYEKTMMAASNAAFTGDWLVAVGIKPSYPSTGYGYLKKGKKWKIINGKAVYRREKHVEKPPLSTAQKYLSSGKYFWNANHYVWRADTFLKSLRQHAPEIDKRLELITKAIGTSSETEVLRSEFEKMPKISVDFAVSEKAENFLMLIADYEWTDIGDWGEVWKHLKHDKDGNVTIDGSVPGGSVKNIDTSNALFHMDGRLIAVIDVDDVIIVDTKDALLVCKKSQAQNVKRIVEELKKEKRKDLL